MNDFTINNYEMKREIVNFSKKISKECNKPESKFVLDMIYGISKSKDILLSSISNALDENIKKAYTIDRLSENLACDLDSSIDKNYCNLVMDSLGDTPVFIIDDSDIVKPLGEKFEALGTVRDGSSKNKNYEKGYHLTEIVGLTKNFKQPISIFSQIYSSSQEEYVSDNTPLFEGMNKVIDLLNVRKKKGIFVHDRGYDNNDIFNFYTKNQQYFVIRLKENRNIYFHHKWYKITTLRDSKKGKVKMKVIFQGEEKECYVSALKVQITAKKKWIYLLLIYGLQDTPMLLASNIPIKCKNDLIKITRCYLDRWTIEEYFRFKKQEYNFENFRVRTLKAINNLNKLLSYSIGLVALLSEKIGKNKFVNKVLKESNSLRKNVYFWFYQIARGIFCILSKVRTGIKEWQNIRKVKQYDGQLSLL